MKLTIAQAKTTERKPSQALLDQRKRLEEAALPAPTDIKVEVTQIGSLGAEWITPPNPTEAVILYFHGGGFTKGSLTTHRELVSRIARASGARLLQVDYRLAPESQYPGQQQDAMDAYRFVLD